MEEACAKAGIDEEIFASVDKYMSRHVSDRSTDAFDSGVKRLVFWGHSDDK